jgi:hypothetical protein
MKCAKNLRKNGQIFLMANSGVIVCIKSNVNRKLWFVSSWADGNMYAL